MTTRAGHGAKRRAGARHVLLGRVSASAHFLVYGPMTVAVAAGSALIAVLDHRAVLVGLAGCGAAVALALVVRGESPCGADHLTHR
ncbi:hypothetical protein ACQPZG_26555 [Streptomyces sp. CA-294286]|uniref:hypothetical protein n=1 Tax=Streptomyces sp. CA-294286 TaxID=3240070 RepID=UPI003D8C665E